MLFDSANRDSSSSSSDGGSSRRSFSSGNSGTSKGILKNRYGDHPNCDICNVGFDVTKRRHQWYVQCQLARLQ